MGRMVYSSIGLGVEDYPRFSLVFDDIGYIMMQCPSRLENILIRFGFQSGKELMEAFKEDAWGNIGPFKFLTIIQVLKLMWPLHLE